MKDPRKATKFSKEFNWTTVGWNSLFNVGHIFSGVVKAVNFFYYDKTDTNVFRSWGNFGSYLGRMITTPFYSKYSRGKAINF